MDNKIKRRLTISAFLGVISIGIASLSFSIAWYASSALLVIDSIDITIKGEPNLLISPDKDGEYKEELSYSDLDKVELFYPVSSMFKGNWLDEKANKPEFYQYSMADVVDPLTNEPYYDVSTKGLYSQSLFLTAEDNLMVTLDKESIKVEADEVLNDKFATTIKNKYPEYTHEEIVERLNSLKDCIRISLLVLDEDYYSYTIIDPYKTDEDILLGGVQDLNKDKVYDHYVDYYNHEMYETIYGEVINRDKAVYDERLPEEIETTGEYTSFNANTAKNTHRFNLEKSLENGLEIKKEDSISIDEVENIMIPVYIDNPTEVVLSIYMEGWDPDCVNAHMGGSFTARLSFKIYKEMDNL